MAKISVGFRLSDQAIGHLEQITRATGATKTATVETALALMAEKFKGENKMDVENYVEGLFQRDDIESVEAYAEWVRGLTIVELSQHLVNQPEDVPDAWDLLAWAESRA